MREEKKGDLTEVFQKVEAVNYSQRSYDRISYVWPRPTNSQCRSMFRLNHIFESAELDIFQELIE